MAAEVFIELCRAEIDLVTRLVSLLLEEQKVLIQGLDERLTALSDEKNAVLSLLTRQSAKRGAFMQQLALQDKEAVYCWLADKPIASKVWTELEEALRHAQSINQLNSGFLEQRLSVVEKALDSLRTAATASLGYDKEGQQAEVQGGGRFLGSA
ncbi:flagellar protein FlgN [Neisseriaceae bacterium TC5R-5]|nr:flagellar protein FlgN [Neisseriaceae bacterium TC5R-5]